MYYVDEGYTDLAMCFVYNPYLSPHCLGEPYKWHYIGTHEDKVLQTRLALDVNVPYLQCYSGGYDCLLLFNYTMRIQWDS